jgi:hypothetical protein
VFERDLRDAPLAVLNNVLAATRRPDVICGQHGLSTEFLCADDGHRRRGR